MISIAWPNMFNKTTTNVVYDKAATMQNLKILLRTDNGELWGDPQFGANLSEYMYDPNDDVAALLIRESVYVAIATYMPQLVVNRTDIIVSSKGDTVYITITALNKIDYQTDLYNIQLTNNMIEGE